MKKQLFAAAVMLLAPVVASASDSVYKMEIVATSPIYNNIYYDYDIKNSTFTHVSGSVLTLAPDNSSSVVGNNYTEVYCVSDDPLIHDTASYTFKSIGSVFSSDKINFITWVANYGAYKDNGLQQENVKASAQAAIWYYLGIVNTGSQAYYYFSSMFYSHDAGYVSDYDQYADEWMVAINGVYNGSGCDGQDFLVKASPVPVPSSVLLLGSGLLGLVAAGRRKRQ